jgi:zinc D-Ala-D-Ala carboxypeptidase
MLKRKNSKYITALVFGVFLAAVVYYAWPSSSTTASRQDNSANSTKPVTAPSTFNKNQYSLDDPSSIWVVVNKTRPLRPQTYIPSDLVIPKVSLRVPGNESMRMRQVTAAAIEKLFGAAGTDGIQLMVSSGYRSYNYQVGLYGGYAKQSGQAAADNFSARPGYSEHQTGLAVDIEPQNQQCDVSECFADLPAGKWLAANAYKYGFILRYPADKVAVTGYTYEPWHVRYIGTDLAERMHQQNVETLEEFFGLPAAPNYPVKS